jgi:hypothetical protein
MPLIFLPDISVYLQNAATSATNSAVSTNLDGTFAFQAQPAGNYRLCWKAIGYTSGCSATTFNLGATTIYLQPTAIMPQSGLIYGRVALKDGAACRFVLPAFNRNTFTSILAAPASGPRRLVHANSSGMYLVPALASGNVVLKATCEGAQTTITTTVTGGLKQVNMTLPNVRPTIQVVYAQQVGKMVRAAAAGSTVQIVATAHDGGGYALHYSWLVDPASSGFISADAPSVNWTIPSGAGQANVYLLAHDDHGGNAFWHVPLTTAPHHIAFSGHVVGNNALGGLAGATVSINGVVAQSNADGNFALALPKEEARYVVTITKWGYQMLSRSLYAPASKARFELYQAQQFTLNPTATNTLTEKPRKDQKTGAQIIIKANTVALGRSGTGALVTTPLRVQLASYNLQDANNQVPGDYGGIDKEGNAAALQTFGALDVQMTDAAGNPVNLTPGAQALVRIPIASELMASAPNTIPVWHYDTTKGMWSEDGIATKVGGFYETNVSHFSAVNMDLAFSNAACTIINVDTSIMPVPFQLHMTVASGPQVQQSHQEQWISDAVNIVVREPPNTQVTFSAEDGSGNIYPNTTQTINTGASTPSAVEWNPAPSPPYGNDCSSSISYNEQTLSSQNPNNPSPIFPLASGGFLTYQTPQVYLTGTPGLLAAAYYQAIDPVGSKTTPSSTADFANWKTANGFSRGGVTRVDYQNLYDLGFGRDMYMQTGGATGSCAACVAFYVTNYTDADAAANAVTGTAIATVAMEYGPLNETGATFTRFYVFGANGAISDTAALDDFGPKYVPALCVVCHNGNIASNATTTAIASYGGNLTYARFIAFDLDSFAYPATATRASQEGSFKTMNAAILADTNRSQTEVDLITAWYGTEGDLTLPNATLNGAVVPSAWQNIPSNSLAPTLYSDVVKTSCRACHSTRDTSDFGQAISWGRYIDFNNDESQIHSFVCSQPSAYPMPQAERTFARFWLSTNPNAPITLANSGLTGWSPPSCQ